MKTHTHFADWYSRAAIAVTAESLQARWQGLDTFAEEASASDALELTRLYFKLPLADPAFPTNFKTTIKDRDALFLMEGNDNEVRVLAGAALVQLLEGDPSHLGDAAALAVQSANLQGLKAPATFHDVVPIAARYLSNSRANERNDLGESVSPIGLPANWDEQLKNMKALCSGNSLPQMADSLNALLQSLTKSHRSALNSMVQLDRRMRVYREEADIAWWILGEHSRTLSVSLKSLGGAAPLVCGSELAELVEVMPGPATAPALLDRMLSLTGMGASKPVTIEQAVAATSPEWRAKYLETHKVKPLGELAPVSLAIHQFSESEEAWRTVFMKRTGVSTDSSLRPAAIAEQTMVECLLARAVAESDSE